MRAERQAVRWSVALILALLCCLPAHGRELLLDAEHSRVRFSIPVLWLFHREGDFSDLALRVDVDDATGLADIEARVQVASARMDNPADVATLKSRDYFDALNHPEIRFTASAVPLAVLRKGGELAGQLSLRGVTREVRFRIAPDPCDHAALSYCPFELAGAIQRHDYGMSARRGILGDEVSVAIRLVPAEALGDAESRAATATVQPPEH